MGLLEGESWDDYMNKEVYVTSTFGESGYKGIVKDYNEFHILVQKEDGETTVEEKHEDVYGTWIIEDW
jgi:hypothetical protein